MLYNDYITVELGKMIMNISSTAIISNSDMIKNYKSCREKAESLGKVLVLKNNQPDAVLFSIAEYERISAVIEYLERQDDDVIDKVIDSMLNRST